MLQFPEMVASAKARVFAVLMLAMAVFAPALGVFADEPAATARAEAPVSDALHNYTRTVEDAEKKSVTLELAIRTFKKLDGTGPDIHLVSAVHIADVKFYSDMQVFLDKQDLVLFEGVRPPGSSAIPEEADDARRVKITKRRAGVLVKLVERYTTKTGHLPGSMNEIMDAEPKYKALLGGMLKDGWGTDFALVVAPAPVDRDGTEIGEQTAVLMSLGSDGKPGGEGTAADTETKIKVKTSKEGEGAGGNIQKQLAEALDLAFQLEQMDSTKANWSNSDLSVDEVQERIEAAGGDAQALFGLLDGSSMMSKLVSFSLGLIKSMPMVKAQFKLMMIEMLANSDAMMSASKSGPMAAMGPAMKVIVTDRNQVVVADIKKALMNPGIKSVAAFYGAGHMPELEKQLVDELGLKATGEQWIPAITMTAKSSGLSFAEMQSMRKTVSTMMKAQLGTATKAKKEKKAKQEEEKPAGEKPSDGKKPDAPK